MSRRLRTTGAAATVLVLLAAGVLAGQEEEEHQHMMFGQEVTDPAVTVPAPYQLQGDDLPDYYVVDAFFRVGQSRLWGGARPWGRFLDMLEVEEHSKEESVIRDAIVLATLTTSRRLDLGPHADDPEAWEAAQLEFARELRQELAVAFLELRRGLANAGGSLEALERFLEEKMRQAVTVGATGEPSAEWSAMEEAFTEVAFAPLGEEAQ